MAYTARCRRNSEWYALKEYWAACRANDESGKQQVVDLYGEVFTRAYKKHYGKEFRGVDNN